MESHSQRSRAPWALCTWCRTFGTARRPENPTEVNHTWQFKDLKNFNVECIVRKKGPRSLKFFEAHVLAPSPPPPRVRTLHVLALSLPQEQERYCHCTQSLPPATRKNGSRTYPSPLGVMPDHVLTPSPLPRRSKAMPVVNVSSSRKCEDLEGF